MTGARNVMERWKEYLEELRMRTMTEQRVKEVTVVDQELASEEGTEEDGEWKESWS